MSLFRTNNIQHIPSVGIAPPWYFLLSRILRLEGNSFEYAVPHYSMLFLAMARLVRTDFFMGVHLRTTLRKVITWSRTPYKIDKKVHVSHNSEVMMLDLNHLYLKYFFAQET